MLRLITYRRKEGKMTAIVDAQCGECGTNFTTPVGSVLQCPACEAVLLLTAEGQLAWVRLAVEQQNVPPQPEQVGLGGPENGRIAH